MYSVHGKCLEIAKSLLQMDYVACVYRPLRCLAFHNGQHTVLLSALCAFKPFAMLSASTLSLYLFESKSLYHTYSSHYFRETCIFGRCMIVIKSLNVSHGAISPPTHVKTLLVIGGGCQIVNPHTSPQLAVSASCMLSPQL